MNEITHIVLTALYFIAPAYFANMCPVFASKLNLPFNKPIHEKKLGKNKTWRGIYSGIIGASIFCALQGYWQTQNFFEHIRILDYTNGITNSLILNSVIFGFLLGGGALIGDSVKSFLKRKKGIASGKPWFPFDQLDFIFGAIVFMWPIFKIPTNMILTLILITPILHFLTNIIGYHIGLKKVWW